MNRRTNRDYNKIMAERIDIRSRAEEDAEFRRDVLFECKDDILYWFDNFAWTLDPRKETSQLPFIPYAGKQIKYIEWLESLFDDPRDGFVDKPRDVGATALTMNVFLYHWLFDDYFNARIGSRKEDYVDKTGDPDTLFYKLDYTLDRLPVWMLPEGWNDNIHRSHMRLLRPDNSNTIVGESANPSFARGGRQTIVFFDEIGFWSFARSAWESAGDVTEIRLAMTTPPDTGKSSHAYKLYSGQAGKVDTFEFNWTDIPSKSKEWLAEQRERRSKEEFEREIMKSYSGTTEGKVYAAEWKLHVVENDVDYNPNLPLFVAWDFGLDEVAMIWMQKNMATNDVRVIDAYHNSNKPIDFYVPFVTGQVISGLHEYDDYALEVIRRHKDWKRDITHYGDPDVQKRNLTDKKSAFKVLQEKGIFVNSKPWAGRKHRDLREKALLLLRRLEVNYPRCEYFVDCMLSAKYPKRTETAQPTTPLRKPVHDWTSHFRSAFEYFADNEPFRKEKERKKIQDVDPNDPFAVQNQQKSKAYKPLGGYK